MIINVTAYCGNEKRYKKAIKMLCMGTWAPWKLIQVETGSWETHSSHQTDFPSAVSKGDFQKDYLK